MSDKQATFTHVIFPKSPIIYNSRERPVDQNFILYFTKNELRSIDEQVNGSGGYTGYDGEQRRFHKWI